MIDTKPKSVNTYWKTSIQKTQIVIAFLISSFFLAVGGHVGYAAAFSDANYDINNLVNFEQNILPTQSRSTNNHIERLGMPSTFAVDDSTIPWPTNNDFYLTDNPDGGKIAYVHNAKQLLHAIYGFGTDYKNIDIRSGTGTWGYSDITKIVLTKDIDIPNLANDPDITFATPSTGAGATVRSTGAINNVNHDPYMLNFSQINNYGSLTSPSAPHSGKYSGQDGGEWNLRIIHSSNKPDDLTTEISGKVQSTFTIDGQGHTWNLGNFSIFLRQDRAANITLNNMKIYGSNYFGPIRTANMTSVPTVLTYKDITYYGSQLLYSNSGVTVHFQGDCIGYALYSYIGPDGNVYSCQGTITGSAQQLLEGQNINFDADCNFKGYTYGGHVLLVTGNVTVGDRANVELHPHYMRGGPNHNSAAEAGVVSAGNTPIGLAVVGNQGDLTMQHNAQLNIIVDRKPLADSIPTADKGLILKDKNDTWYDSRMTDGFYATPLALSLSGRGNLQYVTNSNSVINIKSDGAIGSNNLINLTGGQANIGEGEMNVEAKNLGNNNGATASLLSTSNAANIFVDRNGSFSMSAPKATSRVYLINSRGSCRINIYKPKKLHLERPNKASVLLHGTGNVEMHGVKETALADNPDDPSGPDISIRDTQFQYLNLPFSSDRLQSSANGTTMSAQTSAINLVKLKQLLAQLSPNNNSSFPQFRVFDATAIDPGPVIAKPLPTIDPQHRLIEGDVVDDNTTRQPAIGARLHVTLTRTGSSTPIDLGDSGATVAELNPNKDSLDPGNIFATPAPTPTAVEPDEGLWFEHHHDSSGMATNDLTAKGNLLAQPWRYVTDSKVVTWDNTGHFQLDVDKLIAEYDKNNAANPIGTLVPNDKLQITVVNNFQASVVKTVKISSLYLNLNDKQAKKYYVLGDDIQVPLIYQENIASSKQMNVKGYLNPTAHSTLKPNAADFSSDLTIKGDNKSNQLTWTIPATPPNKVTGSTKDYELKFYGTDDQGGQSPTNAFDDGGNILADQLISYKYTVLNLPGYSGNKQLYQGQDKRFSTEAGFTNPDRLGMGNYTEKDFFAPKDDTATIDNVTFTRGDGTAADTDSPDVQVNHVVKVIATNKAGKSQTHTYITNGNPIKVLPKDFGLIAVGGSFPQGTSFEVDTNVRVLKPTKDLKLASLHMQTDFTHSDGSHEDIQLGESGQIKIGNVYYLQLTVPNRLDFGKHRVGKFTDTTYSLTNKQSVYDNLLLVYDPIANNHLQVTMKLQNDLTDDSNNIWKNALFFKQTVAPHREVSFYDNNGQPISVPIYDKQLPARIDDSQNNPVNTHLSTDWWDNDKQVAGVFLKSKATDAHWGKYKGKIIWNLSNSI